MMVNPAIINVMPNPQHILQQSSIPYTCTPLAEYQYSSCSQVGSISSFNIACESSPNHQNFRRPYGQSLLQSQAAYASHYTPRPANPSGMRTVMTANKFCPSNALNPILQRLGIHLAK